VVDLSRAGGFLGRDEIGLDRDFVIARSASDEAIQLPLPSAILSGLLRFARNDGDGPALIHSF
jgi:hypothetical protein